MATILCIDDQEIGLEVRKLFLEALGYMVLIATNGPDGLRLLHEHAVDLMVLDFRMPGMDGEAVAHKTRELQPGLPIVMLTGYSQDLPPAVYGLVNVVVAKGGPVEEFIGEVRALLGNGAGGGRKVDRLEVLDASVQQAARARACIDETRRHVSDVRKAQHALRQRTKT